MSCFLTSPDRFRREYFECGKKMDTKYLRFGSGVHKMIEDGTYKTLLPDLIVYEKKEFEVRVNVLGIPTLSYIDSYDSINNVFRDTKTGKIPWTQAKVIKHGQLVFYATVLKHSVGKIPEFADLDWIQTKEGKTAGTDFWREGEDVINVTGYIKSFHREFDEREIEKMEELIVKSANQISDAYRLFLEEI